MVKVVSVDLGRIKPIGRLSFKSAQWWKNSPRFALLRYELDGTYQELGLRMDLDKKIFLDDLHDVTLDQLVKRNAPEIWTLVVKKLRPFIHDQSSEED